MMTLCNKKIKNGKKRSALEDFLQQFGGDTKKDILLSVLYYLPLDSRVKVAISGVFKKEKCLNITNFVLEEKKKQVRKFKDMATTYIGFCFFFNEDYKETYKYILSTQNNGYRVTQVCHGTPFTVACREGDLNMVRNMLQYWRLWGEALGVRLESSTAMVNMTEMPVKTCMGVTTYDIPKWIRGLRRPSPNDLKTPFVSNEGDIYVYNNDDYQTALYETVHVIVSGHTEIYDTEIVAEIYDTHFEIVALLLESGANVSKTLIDLLCAWNVGGRFGVFVKHQTRLITILLPYLKNDLMESLLFNLLKMSNVIHIDKILDQNPELHTEMISEHLMGVLDDFIRQGRKHLIGRSGRFPRLLYLFRVLLTYKNWNQNPTRTIVRLLQKNAVVAKKYPMTLLDVFYVFFGCWHHTCKQKYIEVLHPVICNVPLNDNSYLHFILKEELQWREGGTILIEKRKKAFVMNIVKDKQTFLEKELERVNRQIETGFVEVVQVFPNEVRRLYGINPVINRIPQSIERQEGEFQVSFTENDQRKGQRNEILKIENHFALVCSNFHGKKVEWYDLFGELFLHNHFSNWKENLLLKNFFTTNITTRSCYGVNVELINDEESKILINS